MKTKLRLAAETAFVTGFWWGSVQVMTDEVFERVNGEWMEDTGIVSGEHSAWLLLMEAEIA